jgi:serine protease AprX
VVGCVLVGFDVVDGERVVNRPHRSTRGGFVVALAAALVLGVIAGFSSAAIAAKPTSKEDKAKGGPPIHSSARSLAHLTSIGEVAAAIGADDMWAAGYTGAGIDVAVIDTGIAPVTELSATEVFVGPDLSFEGGVDAVAGLDT